MDITELKQQRVKLIEDARSFVDACETRGEMTADDDTKYSKMLDDADELRKQIEREERLRAEERTLRETADSGGAERPGAESAAAEVRSIGGRMITREKADRATDIYRRYLRGEVLSGKDTDELRALEAGADTAGGFLVPLQEMSERLIKNVDDLVFIRRLASTETMAQAESLGIPTLTDPADFDWTTELATGSEDSTMAFGKRELRPHPLAKRIKVSRTLLRKSSRDPVDLVNQRFAYKQALTQEKAFLTGTGVQRPLGVFTASADGISTDRDVSDDNTTTAMTADGIKNAKYFLKAAYWNSAEWIFHRDGIKQIAKLKDGEGRYLFSTVDNVLEGFNVNISEHAPNTFTTGLYVGLLGDFRQGYQIVDALDMEIQRLDELYAATNQVGFIMRSETDGAPVLEEAFARVTLG